MSTRLQWLVLLSGVAVLAVGSAAWLMAASAHSPRVVWWVACGGGLGSMAVLLLSRRAAAALADRVQQEQEEEIRSGTAACHTALIQMRDLVEQRLEGRARGRVVAAEPLAAEVQQPGLLGTLEREIRSAGRQMMEEAEQAGHGQQVQLQAHVAQRLHVLVNRALAAMDEVQRDVEEPELLRQLFGIDHLIVQFRRQAESLAVLAGETPRQLRQPVSMTTLLRQAIAEIEHHSRVRVISHQDSVAVLGHAATDVTHLLAELAENATRLSNCSTAVELQCKRESGGCGYVIVISDRGVGMSLEQLQQANEVLASPRGAAVGEALQRGLIGLPVTARLAERHGIRVELLGNEHGGTSAVLALPASVLAVEESASAPMGAEARPPEEAPAMTAPSAVLPRRRLPSPVVPVAPADARPVLALRRKPPVQQRPSTEPAAGSGGKPSLPRRSHHPSYLPDSEPAAQDGARRAEPLPGLLADFTAGTSKAAQEPGPPHAER